MSQKHAETPLVLDPLDQPFDDPLCKEVRGRELYGCASRVRDGSNHIEPFSLMIVQFRVESLQVHVHQVVEVGFVERFKRSEDELLVLQPYEGTASLSRLSTDLLFRR